MTIDEHLFLINTLRNVRDELQLWCGRDENVQGYVTDVEDCIKLLYRPSVCPTLPPMLAGKDGV